MKPREMKLDPKRVVNMPKSLIRVRLSAFIRTFAKDHKPSAKRSAIRRRNARSIGLGRTPWKR